MSISFIFSHVRRTFVDRVTHELELLKISESFEIFFHFVSLFIFDDLGYYD